MGAERIEHQFQQRRDRAEGMLIPYFTAGYPDRVTTRELIRTADACGAGIVEVGVPYSDSIADGPVIQDGFHYALQQGHTLNDTFELVCNIRPSVSCGLVAMISYSIVHRHGLDRFLDRAADAGFDGLIIPDVPVEESAPVADRARQRNLAYIGLVAPTTSAPRRRAIARRATGFLYLIAATGTTGERSTLAATLPDQVATLRQEGQLPVCVGFGVSSADHVRAVCACADGAIVGSAIIRRISDALRKDRAKDDIIESVKNFLTSLMTGVSTSASR